MDELLRKNIFLDDDLCKLSPDYKPTNILLRMQVRRTLYRDIHSHNFLKNGSYHSSSCHRKSVKRMKDGYKINKELVKIRNDFRHTNLRNHIIMKSELKTTTKSGFVYDEKLLINDIKIFNDDSEQCMQDLQEDMAKLVLYNDSEFKINSKRKSEKQLVNNNINLRNTNTDVSQTNVDKRENPQKIGEEVDKDEPMRIECAFAYKSPEVTDRPVSCENTEKYGQIDKYKKNTEIEQDFQVNDLQTLLIMMAITKSHDNDHEPFNTSPKCKNDTKEIEIDRKADSTIIPINAETSDITESLHIAPIRMEMDERQTHIMKKYLVKWKEHVTKKKEIMNMARDETLSKFFNKLSKKKLHSMHSPEHVNKAKLLAQDYNTYQHRYRVQKHIIALQKAKLEEQNRLIEELKYNRIIEASKVSVDAMKETVRQTYFEIDKQLKPKIKCLTNELKINGIEEPSLVLQCLKVPRFLQRMEKRAREREEKHAMIRERRIQMEEERIKLKQQAELAKAEMDKEEKMKRIKELRDKRRKEKVETIRKKQYAARLRALIVMADLHYEKTLTARYGIRPFRILIQIKRDNMIKAKLHYDFQLKKNIFLNWMWYTEDMWFERHYMAEDFHKKKLLRKYFDGFKQNVHSYIIKKQVAHDYYDLYVSQLVFRKFREAFEIIKKENECKWQMAVIYFNSNLMFKVFTCWRTLPALNALQREQEARKARWREKVLMVVPDYTPPDD